MQLCARGQKARLGFRATVDVLLQVPPRSPESYEPPKLKLLRSGAEWRASGSPIQAARNAPKSCPGSTGELAELIRGPFLEEFGEYRESSRTFAAFAFSF